MNMHPSFEKKEIKKAMFNLYLEWRKANTALDHDIEKGGFTEDDAPEMFLQHLEDGLVDVETWNEYVKTKPEE